MYDHEKLVHGVCFEFSGGCNTQHQGVLVINGCWLVCAPYCTLYTQGVVWFLTTASLPDVHGHAHSHSHLFLLYGSIFRQPYIHAPAGLHLWNIF